MLQPLRLVLRPAPRAYRAIPLSQALSRAPFITQTWHPLSPATIRVIRFASSSSRPPPGQSIDKEHEKKVAQEKLEARPDKVSTTSSVHQVLESSPDHTKDKEDMSKGLWHDISILRDTFRLDTVPRESRILGLSGTVPYFVTSMSTVFLAWDLTKELPTSNAFYNAALVDHDTARYLLDVIEPLQLGYGAVIISFLGAIHWGLEYAEKQPQHDRARFRYGMGLAASIIAWPTLLMPVEYALITQFGAFIALYYADSRATTRGWAPQWYAKYRFFLTAIVGLAIFLSLIGRANIAQKGALNKQSLHSKLTEPGIADKHTDWAKLEAEERKRIKEEKGAEKTEKEAAAKKKSEEERHNGQGQKRDSQDGEEKREKKDDSKKERKDERNDEARDQSQDQPKDKVGQGNEHDQNGEANKERK